jgi:c-di-GMP-binding flagellar brake protein YcgR
MALVKVSHVDVKLGTPLEFPLYSAAGKLLLSKGYVVQSANQLERIFSVGAFRDEDGRGREPAGPRSATDPLLTSVAHHASGDATDDAPPAPVSFPAMGGGPEVFQITVPNSAHAPVRANYVGSLKGRSLMVALDEPDPALQAGVAVDAKVLFGRSIYLFPTRIIARSDEPFDVLYLDYPQAVKRHTLRQHFRIDANLPARLLRNDAVTTGFEATVVNLSLNGVGFALSQASLQIGEHFKLSIRLNVSGRFHAVVVNCVVRNLRNVGSGVMVGAEFSALPEETRHLVKDFVFEAATGAHY